MRNGTILLRVVWCYKAV